MKKLMKLVNDSVTLYRSVPKSIPDLDLDLVEVLSVDWLAYIIVIK